MVETPDNLRDSYWEKITIIYQDDLSLVEKKKIASERQDIMRKRDKLFSSENDQIHSNLRDAGSRNTKLINKLARKGIILRTGG